MLPECSAAAPVGRNDRDECMAAITALSGPGAAPKADVIDPAAPSGSGARRPGTRAPPRAQAGMLPECSAAAPVGRNDRDECMAAITALSGPVHRKPT
jgi:hypothetical protein